MVWVLQTMDDAKVNNTISYDSSTNKRLRNNPSRAQSLAQDAVQSYCCNNKSSSVHNNNLEYRTIIGLGPGRSGSRSLCELLSYQTNVVHCEHEMIVPRLFPRSTSGHIIIPMLTSGRQEGEEPLLSEPDNNLHQQKHGQQFQPRNKQAKGTWGADRRLEWDVPKLARGEPLRSDEDEALWRVLRLFEQRHVFDGWVSDCYHDGSQKFAKDGNVNGDGGKPTKLGTRGWREYNNATNCNDSSLQSSSNIINVTNEFTASQQQQQMHPTNNQHEECNRSNPRTNPTHMKSEATSIPVIATVSSVGLAYTHEYIALKPSVKILIVLRPCEEVVASFMTKSRGRNHWQKHHTGNNEQNKMNEAKKADKRDNNDTVKVQRDKTWDNAFPNMSNDECRLAMSTTTITIHNTPSTPTSTNEPHHRPGKICAIRAYCKLYGEVAKQLTQQYPDNVRVYDMHSALNDADVQVEMLKWCGFGEPVVDTCLHLNKKKLTRDEGGEQNQDQGR